MTLAFHFVRLGIGLVHKAKGGPANLSAEDLSGLLFDSQSLDQRAGSTNVLEQRDLLVIILKSSTGGIVTSVFQSSQQSGGILSLIDAYPG
jgi:hypothetical protein